MLNVVSRFSSFEANTKEADDLNGAVVVLEAALVMFYLLLFWISIRSFKVFTSWRVMEILFLL